MVSEDRISGNENIVGITAIGALEDNCLTNRASGVSPGQALGNF